MSTSLLYHTWGIRGYNYIHTRYEKGCTIFKVEQEDSSLRCSYCKDRKVKKRGVTERTFKATPVGNRPILIELPVQRVECLALPFPHKSADIYTPTQQVSLTQDLKNRVPSPHYLMPWRRIIFTPEVPTKRGYHLYGRSESCGGRCFFNV